MTGWDAYVEAATIDRNIMYSVWVEQFGAKVVDVGLLRPVAMLEFLNKGDAVYFKLKCRT
jgi:hypothetical protein